VRLCGEEQLYCEVWRRLAVGQKRYSGAFLDGTAGNNDPFDLRSVFHKNKN